MEVTVRTRHLDLSADQRDHVVRRIYAAFDHVQTEVRRVVVSIADVNGPRGGVDKQCRVSVYGARLRPTIIVHVGLDPVTTAIEAVERGAQATVRTVARTASRRRWFAPMLVTT